MVLGGASLGMAAVLTSWLAGPLGAMPTVLLAVLIIAVGAIASSRRRPEVPILALLFSAALIGSPITPAESRYVPSLICMATSVATLGLCLYRGNRLQIPVRSVAILLLAYVAAAGISTLTSTDQRLSLTYLGGIILTLGTVFIVAPTLLTTATARFALAATAGVIGLVLAAASVALWLLGPVPAFGHSLGIYLITELRLGDSLTGLVIPRASGPYIAPGNQALNLSIALVSVLAIRRMVGSRTRRVVLFGIALIIVAILVTMSRTGWLVAIVGVLVFGAIGVLRTRSNGYGVRHRTFIDGAALGALVVLGVMLGGLLTNTIGANARDDLARTRYGDVAPDRTENGIVNDVASPSAPGIGGTMADPSPPPSPAVSAAASPAAVRGGAESSSRGIIWAASMAAIAERPLTGYGPGTNAEALAPFLTGANAYYRGLTSHSTWLRTTLEMGVIGLAAMLGIIVATALTILRRWPVDERLLEPSTWALVASTAAIFVGQSLETLLLGGLTYASLYWALAMGILTTRPAAAASPATIDLGSGHRSPARPAAGERA